jgi:hypothetical protein
LVVVPFLAGFFLAEAETRPFVPAFLVGEELVPAFFARALTGPFFAALMLAAFRALRDVPFDDLDEAAEAFRGEAPAVFDLGLSFALSPALALGFTLAAALGFVFDFATALSFDLVTDFAFG